MTQDDELSLYKAKYDLLLVLFHFIKEFRKEYKYIVDESIKLENSKMRHKPTKR
jgi:hypothetical protein